MWNKSGVIIIIVVAKSLLSNVCDLPTISPPCRRYDFNTLPPEDDEDYIDMGAAILNFYSSLVDLLGHCAPDSVAIKAGRSDSLRARAILRSLISVEDLEGTRSHSRRYTVICQVGLWSVTGPHDWRLFELY